MLPYHWQFCVDRRAPDRQQHRNSCHALMRWFHIRHGARVATITRCAPACVGCRHLLSYRDFLNRDRQRMSCLVHEKQHSEPYHAPPDRAHRAETRQALHRRRLFVTPIKSDVCMLCCIRVVNCVCHFFKKSVVLIGHILILLEKKQCL